MAKANERKLLITTRRSLVLIGRDEFPLAHSRDCINMLKCRPAVGLLFGAVLFVVLLQVTEARYGRAAPKYTDWRLPRTLLPRQYKLRLLPFLEGNFTTSGYVEILLECMQDTQLVVLHMAEITIAKDGLQLHDLIATRRVNIQSYLEDKTRQLLVIGTKNETLRKGMYYRLSIQFTSQLNDNLNGLYRASYNEDGKKKYLATTQFSPTDARRAFPCFDEPGMKAKFQITLGRRKTRKSHSNMPIKQTVPHEKVPDYVWDEYETTLPMSTYILAFIVSEFESVDSTDASSPLHNRVRFQFWARPSSLKHLEYARNLGPKVLGFFESYFNVSFPLPKLDMFAIPDFAVGAMENWGLITYRETSLLYDPARSSAINKQRVSSVVAHELAHQWFGNLVTMEWWGDLWLKEGFASYLEFIGSDAADANLQYGQQFTVTKMHIVFEVDSLATSHPMSMPVSKRNEINELFDSIPYAKGPSVIRMLAGFLGQKSFRAGLTAYLNKKKYQNAVQEDLWTALDKHRTLDDGQDDLPASIETIMNSWSLQSGYPIVTVRRDYENQSAILTQERFYLLPHQNSSIFPLWWIPLTFTTNFNATYSAWMMGTEDGIELELTASPTDWIIFNVDQTGYYRVNYDKQNWLMISQQLRDNHLAVAVLNRAQLLDDALNVARTGEVSYAVALELTRYLHSERHYAPWKAALSAFDYIDRMLSQQTTGRDKLQEYLKWLILPTFQELGFDQKSNDSHLTILNRGQILDWACRIGISECIDNATALYRSWMNQPESEGLINPNYKRTIICAAIKNGGDEEWDFALERYLSTDLSSEKETLLAALGCSTSLQALNTLLEWSLDPKSGIRRQDAQTVFASVARNPLGQTMVFDFALKNWERIVKAFPSLYVLGRLFDSIALTLNTEENLKNLVGLSQGEKGDLGTATRSVNQAVERTRINLNWVKKHSKTVTSLLNSWSNIRTFITTAGSA